MGCIALKVLRELGIRVPAVFTHHDNPNENIWFDSLSKLATDMGIPVYFPSNINDSKWVEIIKRLRPEIILSCYFRQMVGEEILRIPRMAAVNLHGSLLPRYRGRCPVNWQIVNGERVGGLTLHHMVKKADAGDIIAQKEVEIDIEDTALTLYRKLEGCAGPLLTQYIPQLLKGTAPRIPQDHSRASYFGGRTPEDGKIDWSWEAIRIYNLIRAVTWPYPGAFTFLNGEKIMFWKAQLTSLDEPEVLAGTVLHLKSGCMVKTGMGLLKILTVSKKDTGPEQALPPQELLPDRGFLY